VARSPFAPLRGVDLSVRAGEVCGIAGVKEGGRETLMLALAGFVRMSAGSVRVNGTETANRGTLAFRKAGGVYLGAHDEGGGQGEAGIDPVADTLSMDDNLAIHAHRRFLATNAAGRRLKLLDWKRLRAGTEDILEKAGVAGRGRDPGSAFSGGQIQRLVFWREKAEGGSLALFSDFAGALDYKNKQAIMERLAEARAGGAAVLVSSADTESMLDVCDRVVVLYNGRISLDLDMRSPDMSRKAALSRINNAIAGQHHTLDVITSDIQHSTESV
jgi:ABC-type uncharacterized transport system ATPase subunit